MTPTATQAPANLPAPGTALTAYEVLAPYYDAFTANYDYDTWLAELEALAAEHGPLGRDLLDVACGTGKSFGPLLERGYRVTACDLSPGMVDRARRRLEPSGGQAVVADMRALPWSERFDLATCLDDSLNYLLGDGDLAAALTAIRRALRPGGLLLFDLNTLSTYDAVFGGEFRIDSPDAELRWVGERVSEPAPGDLSAATIEIHRDGEPEPLRSRHVQRHHPRGRVEMALRRAGLSPLAVRGQVSGGRLVADPDEHAHRKLVYLAQRPASVPANAKGGAPMVVAP